MMIEIRFHGRGGQGAVTAANILAEGAFLEGKYVQAFPFFGVCLLYTSPSPRDAHESRMPSSA